MSLHRALYNRQITGKSIASYMDTKSLLSLYQKTKETEFINNALNRNKISVEMDIHYENPKSDGSEHKDTIDFEFKEGEFICEDYTVEPYQPYLDICLYIRQGSERKYICTYGFAKTVHNLYEVVETMDHEIDITYQEDTKVIRWKPSQKELDDIFSPMNFWWEAFKISILYIVLLLGVLFFFI